MSGITTASQQEEKPSDNKMEPDVVMEEDKDEAQLASPGHVNAAQIQMPASGHHLTANSHFTNQVCNGIDL